MSEKWYSKSFRRNLVDMHIEDWDDSFLSEFDAQEYFDCLKKAKIQSSMIYMHSHVGLCNWDSETGTTHKAFKNNNQVKKLYDLCHEARMDVIAYYSLIYNNSEYDKHPEWRMIDADGNPSRQDATHGFMGGGRYGLVCPNNAEYREFLIKQFKEFCGVYDFEGIFLDMTFWPLVCHCDSCKERYRKETGGEIPTKIDWNDEKWREFQVLRQRWLGEFAQFCSDELKKIRPNLSIEHQFSPICQPWSRGVDEKVNEANDYVGGDLYGGHLEESYICKIYREASKDQPFEYMTSRCDPGLQLHTTTKTEEDLLLHNYLTLAHHGAILFIDAIDPIGTINPKVYDRIGRVFEQTIPYEEYLTGDLMSEVALIMSYDSKINIQNHSETIKSPSWEHPQLDAQLGISRVLKESRNLYTVLPTNRLERLSDKKAAVLTNAAILREDEMDMIAQYVENGGNLYVSGTTDPRLAKRLLGLEYIGYTKENNTYIAPTKYGQPAFGEEYSAKYPLNFSGKQMLVDNPNNHQVLANITLPYTDPSDTTTFSSIHSNPPGIATEYPAIILGNYKKGKVLWLSASIEQNQQNSYREIINRLISLLHKPEILSSNAPDCVEMTLFNDKEQNRYILHVVNVQEQSPSLKIRDIEICISLPEDIKSVTLAPKSNKVSYSNQNNKVVFKADELELFQTYILEW